MTVSPTGDVDMATAPALQSEIVEALTAPGAQRVVVNLSQVGFMDSAGLQSLVHGRRLADERGISYTVTGANAMVTQVLDLTGLTAYLTGSER
jgi:anti-anti-sigma factor